jgi:hypothetical protein
MNLISKVASSLKRHGLLNTTKKILVYPFNVYSYKIKEKKIFKHDSIEDRFTEIYKSNYWGSKESVSGSGSTLIYTENLRNKLPDLLQKYSIKSIFDAPCGDFNWMKLLLPKININYIGGDIVKDLINSHNINYKNNNTNFIHIDLIKDKFPNADLMICRDCLFHLSYEDTRLVLKNFIDSSIPYLLTTTHKNITGFRNKNISTGFYREIDLFSAPYSFDSKPIERVDDWMYPEPEREMCLWSRDQIITALNAWKN